METNIFQKDLTNAGVYGLTGLAKNATGVGELRYYLDDSGLRSPYGHSMPSVIADLLDIAGGVMWADRNHLRPREYHNFMQSRGWTRQFDLILGVRNPDFWNQPTIKEALVHLLEWLTEDKWWLHFQQVQGIRRPSEVQQLLWSSPPTDALVILYSGGLDSLAGTISLLHTHPKQNVILMSAVSDRLSGVVKKQVAQLQKVFGADRVQHALMPFHLVHEANHKEEKTQRTRGFLFFCFGIAEAVACNATRVITCENGIGLVNLPLNRHQLGAQNARGVHPNTLVLMNALLSLLGFGHIQCEAPHFFKTKAELCLQVKADDIAPLCRTTISCDSFPFRLIRESENLESQLHCGLCTSCLFRRQALFAADLSFEDSMTHYKYDVCMPFRTKESSRLERLKFLLDQKQLIWQACSSSSPETAFLIEFPELYLVRKAVEQSPHIFGYSPTISFVNDLAHLFLRYVDEWKHFPYKLHTT